MTQGPVLIDLEGREEPAPNVTEAPPVPDNHPAPKGEAMQMAARVASRPVSALARWFFGLVGAVVAAMISVAFWDFATGLVDRVPLLGWGTAVALHGLRVFFLSDRNMIIDAMTEDELQRSGTERRDTDS